MFIRRLRHGFARSRRLQLVLRTSFAVLGIIVIKLAVHRFGLEVISINPLFSALVASTVFLLGFLLNGVLTDYKESEKIPGEMASSLETLSLEIRAIRIHFPGTRIESHLRAVADLGRSIYAWTHGEASPTTDELLQQFHRCHSKVVEAAVLLKASTLMGRLMGEMSSLLRAINRIDTIRETDFVRLVYWMAYASTTLLCGGLILSVSSNLKEACFFLSVIAFLLIFLLQLIDDLDNPFGMADPKSAEDVSLDLLRAAVERLNRGA
jgi:predicted membrane chloride channel (bestrophin family)